MTLYVGARDPEFLQLVIVDGLFDFATVTGTEITVEWPGRAGGSAVWAWTLDTSVPGRITLSHVFAADGSDVPRAGRYRFSGWLLTATSRRRIEPAFQLFQANI